MTLSPIFRHCLSGDVRRVQEVLQADPTQLNTRLVLPIPDSDKSVVLTPIFAAAIAAATDVVRHLMDAGASLRSETGEDIFTWACMCPSPADQDVVLDLIFEEEVYPRIHPDLHRVYQSLLIFKDELPEDEIHELERSRYPLSPFNAAVLNGSTLYIRPDSTLVVSSSFRGMTSLELATYRVAVYKLLSCHSDFFPSDVDPKLLFLAIQLGDLETVKALAGERKGDDLTAFLSAELYEGMTPAYIAARHNRVHILEYLKSSKADLSRQLTSGIKEGMAPHCAAACFGHVETLEFYRRLGTDLSQATLSGPHAGMTAAYFAAEQGHAKALDFLEKCGVNLTLPLTLGEEEGSNLAFVAALGGHIEVLKRLAKVNRQMLFNPAVSGSLKGLTPLYVAAQNGNTDAVIYLLEVLDSLTEEERNKFSLPVTGEAETENLGSLAVRKGLITVLKRLIAADRRICTSFLGGQSYLAVRAASEGNVELLSCLTLLGFDLSPLTRESSPPFARITPMYAAARHGQVAAVKYLREVCKINPFLPLTDGLHKGESPVFIAANNRQSDVLNLVGLGASEQKLIDRFRLREPVEGNSLSGLRSFHLACLAADVEGVKASYEKPGPLDRTLSCWDFVLHAKGPRIGPYDLKEQNQIDVIKLFLKNRVARTEIMARIRERNRPRIYQALLSESETLLERVLLNETFLRRILSRQLTMQRGRILWKQEEVSRQIFPDQIPTLILTTIDSVLSKNEISGTLLPSIVARLEEVLATANDQFTTSSLPMTDEECKFLCSLLETLEHVSHELAMLKVGSSLSSSSTGTSRVESFSGTEPPTVLWEPSEEAQGSLNFKRRRAESLPPQAASALSTARTPVTGKRK